MAFVSATRRGSAGGSIGSLTANRTCLATAAVDDLVTESDTIAGGVDVATNNTDIKPVIGVIIAKPNPTTATVLFQGQLTGQAGLTKARKVFLSAAGLITSTAPSSGYVQELGNAIDADKVDFNPQNVRVLRN